MGLQRIDEIEVPDIEDAELVDEAVEAVASTDEQITSDDSAGDE